MPLAGLAPATVLGLVRAALDEDERAIDVNQAPPQPDPVGRLAEHLHVDVRFEAGSTTQAHEIASELHDRAVRWVLAAAPARQGWTSLFEHPERRGAN